MVKVKSKETENKRRQGLCNSDQIPLLVRSPTMKTPKKVVFFSFGHNSFGSDVINSFLHNSLLSDGEIKGWNEIDLAETLTGRDYLSKKKNSMLNKLEDSELEKLVKDLENLVDQEAKRNPNSDNRDLLDLQDLDSFSDFNNGDDHLLMEMLESELKNCKDMKKSEC